MLIDFKQYRQQRRLAIVPRWSVVPTIRRQSVAEHSYGVASIAVLIVNYHIMHVYKGFMGDVLVKCINHDQEESVTGDPPSTSKNGADPSAIRKMSQEDVIVKCADYAEAIVFSCEEEAMGNRLINPHVYQHTMGRMRPFWRELDLRTGAPSMDDFITELTRHTWDKRCTHPFQEVKE